jgi:hypothetical protein
MSNGAGPAMGNALVGAGYGMAPAGMAGDGIPPEQLQYYQQQQYYQYMQYNPQQYMQYYPQQYGGGYGYPQPPAN